MIVMTMAITASVNASSLPFCHGESIAYRVASDRSSLGPRRLSRVPKIGGRWHSCLRAGVEDILPKVEITTKRLLIALLAVDAAGGAVAMQHRVAGEPFGIGGSLDVRNPAVVMLWGTALSAPITSLGLAGPRCIDIDPRHFEHWERCSPSGVCQSRRSGDDDLARGLAGCSSWLTWLSPAHWLSVPPELVEPRPHRLTTDPTA